MPAHVVHFKPDLYIEEPSTHLKQANMSKPFICWANLQSPTARNRSEHTGVIQELIQERIC